MDFITKRLRRYALSAALLGCAVWVWAANLQPQTIRDFRPGLNTTQDPSDICDGCAQDLQNVDVWAGRIQKRKGSVLQNSSALTGNQPVRLLHEFPDPSGTVYLLSVSSNTLYRSSDGGVSNTVITSTHGITSSSEFSAVNAYGKARLTDGTTNWLTFDGSVLSVSTTAPKGKLAAFLYERVFTADVTGNRSTLYASAFGDPEDWTDDGLADDDAFSLFVRQNDGYVIRAIVPFRGALLIFKDYSIDQLTMSSDGLTPILSPISNNIGTKERGSVQVTDNNVIFLAADRFYSYDGVSLTDISANIDDTVKSVRQTQFESRSYTEALAGDFTGTKVRVSAGVYAGQLALSTWTLTETLGTDFAAGTMGVDMTTTTQPGSLGLSSSMWLYDTFADNEITSSPAWTTFALTNGGNTATVDGTSGYMKFSQTGGTGGVVPGAYTAITVNNTYSVSFTYRAVTGYPSDYVGHFGFANSAPSQVTPTAGMLLVAFRDNAGTKQVTARDGTTVLFLNATSPVDFQDGADHTIRFEKTVGNKLSFYVDDQLIISTTPASLGFTPNYFFVGHEMTGTGDEARFDNFTALAATSSVYLSQVVTLGSANPVRGTLNYTDTLNSGNITYAVYSDSDTSLDVNSSSTYISSTSVTNDSEWSFGSGTQHVRYSATLTRSATTQNPLLHDAQLDIRGSSGSYTTGSIQFTDITDFGLFTETRGSATGSLTYAIYTDSDTSTNPNVASTYVASQTLTGGSLISLAAANYGVVQALFSISDSDEDPTIDDFTINWYTSGGAGATATSIYYDDKYMCGVAISSTSVNDTILVFDSNGAWTKYVGMVPRTMTKYRNVVLYGDGLSTGSIYKMEVENVYTDNNTAINAYWISKEFDFGFPIEDKTMMRYYVTARYAANSDAVFEYGVNRGSLTSSTLDLDSVSGFFRKTVVPTSLTYYKGVTHRFKISDSDVDDLFDILSVTLVPRLETAP